MGDILLFQVVDRLDDPSSYLSYLSILGEKHIMYEADPESMDQMGFMFLTAIKPILEKEVGSICRFDRNIQLKESPLALRVFHISFRPPACVRTVRPPQNCFSLFLLSRQCQLFFTCHDR